MVVANQGLLVFVVDGVPHLVAFLKIADGAFRVRGLCGQICPLHALQVELVILVFFRDVQGLEEELLRSHVVATVVGILAVEHDDGGFEVEFLFALGNAECGVELSMGLVEASCRLVGSRQGDMPVDELFLVVAILLRQGQGLFGKADGLGLGFVVLRVVGCHQSKLHQPHPREVLVIGGQVEVGRRVGTHVAQHLDTLPVHLLRLVVFLHVEINRSDVVDDIPFVDGGHLTSDFIHDFGTEGVVAYGFIILPHAHVGPCNGVVASSHIVFVVSLFIELQRLLAVVDHLNESALVEALQYHGPKAVGVLCLQPYGEAGKDNRGKQSFHTVLCFYLNK